MVPGQRAVPEPVKCIIFDKDFNFLRFHYETKIVLKMLEGNQRAFIEGKIMMSFNCLAKFTDSMELVPE